MNLKDCLQHIYDAHGKVDPQLLVTEITPPDHPLHTRIPERDWDDTIAGPKWRLHLAAELIRSVKVVFTNSNGEEFKVNQWYAIERREDSGYQPLERIVEDDLSTAHLLALAEREWKDLHARYAHLQEFVAMVREAVA